MICILWVILFLKLRIANYLNSWDVDFILQRVGPENLDGILEDISKTKPGLDVLIWTNNDNGLFSTKSGWDCVRIRGGTLEGHSWMWHNNLPLKMPINMWKAWYMALSVDHHLRRIGIPIISRCDCCANGHYKDQNHVLFATEIASTVWHYFGASLGIPNGQNWKDTMQTWFCREKLSSQPMFTPIQRCKAIAWQRPLAGWVKLNTDGSNLGSNNQAKLLALLNGLQVCKSLSFNYVEIELDSLTIISWWSKRCRVWYLEDF
ncbi:uncharacterized protein LOC121253444 [Juglans microcarpa x Juglans regia]|uniref:uncharacterized protein LOC121253444 n=1 Tax=Juglans microcarpa x Juglans regia TaxID=2249226 RepID=UPI001B7E34B7|nr:uncharacterized protein LOC121253444 [Juglans microcarpa x Juglans regia]